jgi:hypothetical protein
VGRDLVDQVAGGIEVSETPLVSPWNTRFYRLLGPDYPAEGTLVTEQVVQSAFELPWGATLAAGRRHILSGRSWSGHGRIRRVEVSIDGSTWERARPAWPALDRGGSSRGGPAPPVPTH